MAMYLRYSGAFPTLGNHVCRCDILQENEQAFPAVGDLDFSNGGLSIEWTETPLDKPLCASMATLTINSPGDRTYIDLYSVKPCQIRLEVFLDNTLYWSGCLDPEFYEEPYDRASDYDVSLTFSDFGVLGRIPYDLSGRKTLREILEAALSRASFRYSGINEGFISTEFEDESPMTLQSLSIPSANFFDEDGEAASYKEVLEGMLQPLGLRMIQRNGLVWVYDINALMTMGASVRGIVWDGGEPTMGTNRVYNNIKITFSPYSSGGSKSGGLEYDDINGPEWTNLMSQAAGVKYKGGQVPSGMTAPECYSFYPDYDENHRHNSSWDYNLVDFTIFLSSDGTKCTGLAAIGADNRYFKILPMLGGSESAGVATGFFTGGHGSLDSGFPSRKGISPTVHTQGSLALRTNRSYLPALSAEDQEDNYLKIAMDLLVDPRYNPFEDAGDANEKSNYQGVEKRAGIALVPVAIVMYDENGTALCHWSNRTIVENCAPADSIANTKGEWVSGEASWGDAWLAWYDNENPLTGCAVLGWKRNRQCFGVPLAALTMPAYRDGNTLKPWWSFDSFLRAPEGQFIPYPPDGGYLEVRVYNGVWIFKPGEGFSSNLSNTVFNDWYSKIRWQLLGSPEITMVKRTLTLEEVGSDDIEYSGVINRDAQEDLSISTICGTTPEACPTSLGNYIKTSTGLQIRKMRRAGRVEQVEHLLIGTLYSQFAGRKTTLRGDVRLDTAGIALYSDAAQDQATRFLMTGEIQDIEADCSEATFVEVRPDEYIGEDES